MSEPDQPQQTHSRRHDFGPVHDALLAHQPGDAEWAEVVSQFCLELLLPQLAQTLRATVKCYDGSFFPPIAAGDYERLSLTDGNAGTILIEFLGDLWGKLENCGPHPNYEKDVPYQQFLCGTATIKMAQRRANQLRNDARGSDDDDGRGGLDQSPAPAAAPQQHTIMPLRLRAEVQPQERTAQMAGIQLQPQLDWSCPACAGELKDHLERKVIIAAKESTSWDTLTNAHEEAAEELREKRAALKEQMDAARNADTYSRYAQRLVLHDCDMLRMPLNTPRVKSLTNWSEDNIYQLRKRYLQALPDLCDEPANLGEDA